MTTPRVTVITGYYNRGPLLRRTVDSILNQSFRDFQFVVFDDGSQDDTWQQLQAYDDPRLIKIRHQPNIGFVAGMIEAISRTRSPYIAIQGSGDISLPTRLEKQLALLEANPDMVAAGCYYTNVVAEHNWRRPRQPVADGITFSQLLRGNIFSHGEVMMRRDAYEKAGGYAPEFRFAQDYDLWLRLIRLGRFGTVRENLYDRYIQFADGVSYKPDKFIAQYRLVMLAQQLAQLSPEQQRPLRARIAAGEAEALIPLANPALQKAILKAALRLLAFGNIAQADTLYRDYLTRPLLRPLYQSARGLLASPLGPPLRHGMNCALGIRSAG